MTVGSLGRFASAPSRGRVPALALLGFATGVALTALVDAVVLVGETALWVALACLFGGLAVVTAGAWRLARRMSWPATAAVAAFAGSAVTTSVFVLASIWAAGLTNTTM